ncbi:elongation factor 1-beta [Candidatus Woesearchaeota archaeon]|nr:elongation factor 1-beta [Candidatus Woesearchaeota archaeon]
MARVIVTLRIMPDHPGANLQRIKTEANKAIKKFCNEESGKTEEEPIGFGLVALKLYFIMDEAKGSTEPLEKDIAAIPEVGGVEVIDVRRAMG